MEKPKATTSIFIDSHHPRTNGLCSVSIRVTFERKKRYYPTKYSFTPADFEKIIGERPRNEFKEAAQNLNAIEKKASDIIKELPLFSWISFEKRFLNNRGAKDEIDTVFQDYIAKLKEDGRIGTAVSYNSTVISINKFHPNTKFKDITPDFLHRYEQWMLDAKRSITSVGIYARQLRTIFNIAIDEGLILRELYPFGAKKYEIPTGNNIKKALKLSQVEKIYKYKPKRGSKEELAKNIWLFLYLCHGINLKDLCLFKYENIQGEFLVFVRAKTVKTKRKVEPIRVGLTKDLKSIIEKHGNKDANKNSYIFPVLSTGISQERERQLIQQFRHLINDYLVKIAKKLAIDERLTSGVARHSFATILRDSGEDETFIGELMGHSDPKTTRNYFAKRPDEIISEKTKALTAFNLKK